MAVHLRFVAVLTMLAWLAGEAPAQPYEPDGLGDTLYLAQVAVPADFADGRRKHALGGERVVERVELCDALDG